MSQRRPIAHTNPAEALRQRLEQASLVARGEAVEPTGISLLNAYEREVLLEERQFRSGKEYRSAYAQADEETRRVEDLNTLIASGDETQWKQNWRAIVRGGPALNLNLSPAYPLSEVTPLMAATRVGSVVMMENLLRLSPPEVKQKVRVNHRDAEGLRALEFAVRFGKAEAAQFLIERGATVVRTRVLDEDESQDEVDDASPQQWETYLHMAADRGDVDVMKALLNAPVNALVQLDAKEPEYGMTPLMRALRPAEAWGFWKERPKELQARKAETARLLLQAGASVTAVDNENWTPLVYALWYVPRGDVVRALLKKGAKMSAQVADGNNVIQYVEKRIRQEGWKDYDTEELRSLLVWMRGRAAGLKLTMEPASLSDEESTSEAELPTEEAADEASASSNFVRLMAGLLEQDDPSYTMYREFTDLFEV